MNIIDTNNIYGITATNYCPGCDTHGTSHICLNCNDYTLTTREALDNALCTCDVCDLY